MKKRGTSGMSRAAAALLEAASTDDALERVRGAEQRYDEWLKLLPVTDEVRRMVRELDHLRSDLVRGKPIPTTKFRAISKALHTYAEWRAKETRNRMLREDVDFLVKQGYVKTPGTRQKDAFEKAAWMSFGDAALDVGADRSALTADGRKVVGPDGIRKIYYAKPKRGAKFPKKQKPRA